MLLHASIRSRLSIRASSVLLASTLALLAAAAPSRAATFVVDTPADTEDATPGDSICADAGNQCSLRAAIMEFNASAPDPAIIQIGLPSPGAIGLDSSSFGELEILADMSIEGPAGGMDGYFVQAGPNPGFASSRVVRVGAGVDASISDLIIRNGVVQGAHGAVGADSIGGGILVEGTLSLARVRVTGSRARGGDGSAGRGGDAIGGGIGVAATGTLNLVDVLIDSNFCLGGASAIPSGSIPGFGIGGGIGCISGSSGTLLRSTIAANAARGGSGALAGSAYGGGFGFDPLFSGTGLYRMTNCTFTENQVESGEDLDDNLRGLGVGGGVAANGSGSLNVILEYCTVSANQIVDSTPATGGGVAALSNNLNEGARMAGCIVTGNTAVIDADLHGNWNSSGSNLVGSFGPSGRLQGTGTGFDSRTNTDSGDQTGVSVALLARADNGGETPTMELVGPLSIAFDAGAGVDVDGAAIATDQRGIARPQFGAADVGAFESEVALPVVLSEISID